MQKRCIPAFAPYNDFPSSFFPQFFSIRIFMLAHIYTIHVRMCVSLQTRDFSICRQCKGGRAIART